MGTVQLVRRGPNGGQAPELPRGQAQEALASDVGGTTLETRCYRSRGVTSGHSSAIITPKEERNEI